MHNQLSTTYDSVRFGIRGHILTNERHALRLRMIRDSDAVALKCMLESYAHKIWSGIHEVFDVRIAYMCPCLPNRTEWYAVVLFGSTRVWRHFMFNVHFRKFESDNTLQAAAKVVLFLHLPRTSAAQSKQVENVEHPAGFRRRTDNHP